MPALTDQQQHFVHHLVTSGCNPTEAARTAGYAVPKQEAYRLTRLAHVQDVSAASGNGSYQAMGRMWRSLP